MKKQPIFAIISPRLYSLTPEESSTVIHWETIQGEFEKEHPYKRRSAFSDDWHDLELAARAGDEEAMATIEKHGCWENWANREHTRREHLWAVFHKKHREPCRAALLPILARAEGFFVKLRAEYVASTKPWFARLEVAQPPGDAITAKIDAVISTCLDFKSGGQFKGDNQMHPISHFNARLFVEV